MKSNVFGLILLAALALPAVADTLEIPEPGTKIPPVNRDKIYFEAGARFLSTLPDGTQVQVHRLDGTKFDLRVENSKLLTDVPKAVLGADRRVLTTPLGWQIVVERHSIKGVLNRIKAPNGHSTEFRRRESGIAVLEHDGSMWQSEHTEIGLRLPDATRIDLLENRFVWEVNAITGQRYRIDLRKPELTWEEMPAIPSPPLIPDMQAVYVGGDGDDWRRPAHEDHLVFAWSWYPYGLQLDRAVEDVRDGNRRDDLRVFFNAMPQVQPFGELGGYLLARRLALEGGDRLTIATPDGVEQQVFLLPGPLDPDRYMPTPMPAMALPRINMPPKR